MFREMRGCKQATRNKRERKHSTLKNQVFQTHRVGEGPVRLGFASVEKKGKEREANALKK